MILKFRTLFATLISGISLFSCKKNNSENRALNIHSTVYDFYSKIPKAGTKVYLLESLAPAIIAVRNWGEEYNIAINYPQPTDSTITSNNGQFNFEFNPRLTNGFYTTPRYHILNDSLFRVYPPGFALSDETDKDSIFVDRKKFLTVSMQKNTPVSPDDSLVQTVQILPPLTNPYSNGLSVYMTGTPFLRKFYYSYPSCNKVLVEWEYYHPNLLASGKDTFDLLPNGTNIVIPY